MDKEIKKEARKQYLKYFRIWFIILGVIAGIFLLLTGKAALSKDVTRTNSQAPTERVFDYANVLTDDEEQLLREYIAKCEAKYYIDLVLVTTSEYMGESDWEWENAMMNYADDFYDEHNFGFDMARGDGALLLDNWYEGQKGSWLSTCGNVYEMFSTSDINEVLDAVYYKVDSSPYKAYKAYIDETCSLYDNGTGLPSIPGVAILLLPTIISGFFAGGNLKQKKAETTTRAETYVLGGTAHDNIINDNFLRKNVVTRRIETSSGGSSSGRGGGHRSSSGTSHGGGGRRR